MIVGTTVCTVAVGDRAALADLVTALNRQSTRPDELVVAYLGDGPYDDLPRAAFRLKTLMVPAGPRLPRPRATARNRAAMVANGRTLIFVDAGCIPGPDVVRALEDRVAATGGFAIGDTRAAPRPDGAWRFDEMWIGSSSTQAEAASTADIWCGDVFALPKLRYLRLGGFDETVGRDAFVHAVSRAGVPVDRDPRAQVVRVTPEPPRARVA